MADNDQLAQLAVQVAGQEEDKKTAPKPADALENLASKVAQDSGALPSAPAAPSPGFLKSAAAIPAGGLQEFGRLFAGIPTTKIGKILKAIPGSGFSLGALARRAASTPQAQQLLQQSPTLGKVGGGLADIASFAGTGELATPLLGEAGGAGILGKLGRAAVKGFPAGAVVSPGHRVEGGLLGSLAEPAAIGAGKALKAIPKMDVVLRSRLGQRVIDSFDKVKNESIALYAKAFKDTGSKIPQLGKDTISNLAELKETFPGKRGGVPRALDVYNKNKNLENLHFLRSDLGKEWNSLEIKRNSPTGLTKSEGEDQALLSEARGNISKSLEDNFNSFNPEKKAQYAEAQSHFENKVSPFREKGHTAIMKALSPDRDLTNKLFTELGADSVKARKVRSIVGLSRSQLGIAKLLRSKLVTIPALGAGLFLGGKKFL